MISTGDLLEDMHRNPIPAFQRNPLLVGVMMQAYRLQLDPQTIKFINPDQSPDRSFEYGHSEISWRAVYDVAHWVSELVDDAIDSVGQFGYIGDDGLDRSVINKTYMHHLSSVVNIMIPAMYGNRSRALNEKEMYALSGLIADVSPTEPAVVFDLLDFKSAADILKEKESRRLGALAAFVGGVAVYKFIEKLESQEDEERNYKLPDEVKEYAYNLWSSLYYGHLSPNEIVGQVQKYIERNVEGDFEAMIVSKTEKDKAKLASELDKLKMVSLTAENEYQEGCFDDILTVLGDGRLVYLLLAGYLKGIGKVSNDYNSVFDDNANLKFFYSNAQEVGDRSPLLVKDSVAGKTGKMRLWRIQGIKMVIDKVMTFKAVEDGGLASFILELEQELYTAMEQELDNDTTLINASRIKGVQDFRSFCVKMGWIKTRV
ncbi:hypothetical protein KC717_01370 [Candidatus Dojkabacteria bacterium]|uniref:Uncharacterized protein n=1 Tax=Candidatus Dojkabacteria bacterium TaxID=2099670 RepID=A0A955L7Z0_9BACT|nr:hypothetical protein [Candidatus Dojkabacteria bacterium]